MAGEDRIPLRSLRAVAGWLISEGHPVNEVLAEVGIDANRLFDPEARIDLDLWFALWRRCEILSRDPALGLRVASAFDPRAFGAPVATEYLLIQRAAVAATVGEALECFARNWMIGFGPVRVDLFQTDDRCEVRLRLPEQWTWPPALVEFMTAMIVTPLRVWPLRPVVPDCVSFRHPAPPSVDDHRVLLGAPVRFGAALDAVELTASALPIELRTANPTLARTLERRSVEVVKGLRPPDDFVARVSAVTEAALAHDGNPTAEGIARVLGISVRTLSRRLRELGTSHRAVLDAMRKQIAHRLLAEGTQVKDVADRLGFADASAFHRAFRRWYGISPTDFRDGLH